MQFGEMLESQRRREVDVTQLEIPAELAAAFSKQQSKIERSLDFHSKATDNSSYSCKYEQLGQSKAECLLPFSRTNS